MSNLIIKLKGGTGNQLFQAAAACSLAKLYKKECFFNIHGIGSNKYKRKLEIEPILDILSIKKLNDGKKIYLDEYDIDHPIYFSEKSPLAFLEIDFQLEGYFTNYRIHNFEIINTIRTYIKNLDAWRKFKDQDYIAVHLRESHGIKLGVTDSLNFEFYNNVFKQMFKNHEMTNIKNAIVFSDLSSKTQKSPLLPKIKKLLKKYEINYINGDNYINSPLEILNIFAYAKLCVISNSTLSWWGGYLSKGNVFSPVMCLWEPHLKIPDNWKQIYGGEINPKTHHGKLAFDNSLISSKLKNTKSYNLNRKRITAITRLLIIHINKNFLILKFKSFIKFLGILPENSHSTFF